MLAWGRTSGCRTRRRLICRSFLVAAFRMNRAGHADGGGENEVCRERSEFHGCTGHQDTSIPSRAGRPARRQAGFDRLVVSEAPDVQGICYRCLRDAAYHSAANICHSPGMPLSDWLPRGSEAKPRARDQILHGARNEHLARAGERRDPCADMDRDAAHIVVHDLALAGMKPGANVDTERFDLLGDGARRSARRVPVRRRLPESRRRLSSPRGRGSARDCGGSGHGGRREDGASADRRAAAFSVDPTMSVKSTVARTRSASAAPAIPSRIPQSRRRYRRRSRRHRRDDRFPETPPAGRREYGRRRRVRPRH